MEPLIVNPSELRRRGFQALTEAIGWVNAVRFLRQFDPGEGDYTEERRTLLPDWDAETLVREAGKLRNPPQGGLISERPGPDQARTQREPGEPSESWR